MKELEKMLEEMLELCTEAKKETKKAPELSDDAKEGVNKLLDGARAVICVTNKGVVVQGHKLDILACLSSISENLTDNGFDDKEIKASVSLGMMKNMDDNELKSELLKSLKELIKEIEGK